MKKPENENSSEGSPYDRLLQLYYERTFEGFNGEFNEEEKIQKKTKRKKRQVKGEIPASSEEKSFKKNSK